jgi:thioesterase domain-containing protein
MDFSSDISALSAEQAALLEMLLQQATPNTQPNASIVPRIVPIQKGEIHKPLFIIHGTGGQVLFLHALARHISPKQPLFGIEGAKSSGGDTGCGRYVEALRAVQPHGPYWLGGYSAGCLIAFEAAAQLRQSGEDVAFLLLIDPVDVAAVPETSPPTPQQLLHRRFELAMLAGVTPLSTEFPAIEQVNRDLAAHARRFRAVPIDQRIHILHCTRGNYVPSPAALQSWACLAGGGLETAAIQADHFEIVRDPHAAATGAKIQCWLDELQNV